MTRIHTWFDSFQEKCWSSKPSSIKSAFVHYLHIVKVLDMLPQFLQKKIVIWKTSCTLDPSCDLYPRLQAKSINHRSLPRCLFLCGIEHTTTVIQCTSQIRNLDVDSFSKLIPSIYSAAYVYIEAATEKLLYCTWMLWRYQSQASNGR